MVLRWCLTVFSEVVSVFGVHICLVHDLDGVRCSFQGSWYIHVMSPGFGLGKDGT